MIMEGFCVTSLGGGGGGGGGGGRQGHIFGGAYTWRGLFSKFYGTSTVCTLQH